MLIFYHQFNVKDVQNENNVQLFVSCRVNISVNFFFINNNNDVSCSQRFHINLDNVSRTACNSLLHLDLNSFFETVNNFFSRLNFDNSFETACDSLITSHRSRVDLFHMLHLYFSHSFSENHHQNISQEIFLKI